MKIFTAKETEGNKFIILFEEPVSLKLKGIEPSDNNNKTYIATRKAYIKLKNKFKFIPHK